MARAYPGKPPGIFEELMALGRRVRRRRRERRCRLAVNSRTLDEQRTAITVLERNRLLVDRSDLGLSQSLLLNGYWEMWLTEAIEAALSPGMVAIDIGANLGYFSVLMAECVGVRGRVHAFEPNPTMAALLQQSRMIDACGENIVLHSEPLWDRDGETVVLRIPVGEPKNANLAANAGYDIPGERLETRRLDSFPELLDADLIKIDVEGAEERIWRGMNALLARGRPLIVFLEFTPSRYADAGAFLTMIEADGFSLSELTVSHGIRPTTQLEILAGDPDEDRMLALFRG